MERYNRTLENNAAQAADEAEAGSEAVSAPGLSQGDSLATHTAAASPQGNSG